MSHLYVSRRPMAAGWVLALLLIPALLAGCRRDRAAMVDRPQDSRFGTAGVDRATDTAMGLDEIAIRLADSDERLYVFNGRTAEPMTGRQVLRRLRQADVVILGEMHTDPMAHRLQERFVREALAAGEGALSLEMMSRDEQAALSGLSGRPAAAEQRLAPTSLSGWPRWRSFYLPAIEAALALDRPVVAANAPREIVRSARTQGYDYLRDLPPEQQRLFDLPGADAVFPDYRRRVGEAVSGHAPSPGTQPATRPARERVRAHAPSEPPASQGTTRPTTGPATRRALPPRDPMSADAFYDSQLVWDATMANSILTARRRYGAPIVHMVGSFHSDFDGGLTQMLRQRGQDVVTVSFVPADSQRLAPADFGRADIVIYTGADRPLPPELAPATRPSIPPARPATRPATRRS